jgi:hypothetical protein
VPVKARVKNRIGRGLFVRGRWKSAARPKGRLVLERHAVCFFVSRVACRNTAIGGTWRCCCCLSCAFEICVRRTVHSTETCLVWLVEGGFVRRLVVALPAI